MSTRCQIGFYSETNQPLKKFDALLYKHSDGYPGELNEPDSGIVPLLMPFLIEFNKVRGLSDSEYAAAWCMHYLIDRIIKRYENSPSYKDGVKYIGYGVCQELHGDIEYYYAVYPNRLKVYKTPLDCDWKNMRLIQSISFANSKLDFHKVELLRTKENLEQSLKE